MLFRSFIAIKSVWIACFTHYQNASRYTPRPAAPIHFLIVFQTDPQPQVHRSPSKFKVRFMSAQYVKTSSCANYERAICQESEAEQAILCILCLMYSLLLCFANHLPCPFSLADNHFLLSSAPFSPVCCLETLHFTAVFTDFADFDLF